MIGALSHFITFILSLLLVHNEIRSKCISLTRVWDDAQGTYEEKWWRTCQDLEVQCILRGEPNNLFNRLGQNWHQRADSSRCEDAFTLIFRVLNFCCSVSWTWMSPSNPLWVASKKRNYGAFPSTSSMEDDVRSSRKRRVRFVILDGLKNSCWIASLVILVALISSVCNWLIFSKCWQHLEVILVKEKSTWDNPVSIANDLTASSEIALHHANCRDFNSGQRVCLKK